jgi:ElaB/YqjD/DUF883 family membrane-anchored ribosome-binding protein
MSNKSRQVGKAVLQGIDTLEASAHDTVHASANGVRFATKAGARWAADHESAATDKARVLRRDLRKQSAQLRRSMDDTLSMASDRAHQAVASSQAYIKRKPLKAIAIASGAAVVVGALLGCRRS